MVTNIADKVGLKLRNCHLSDNSRPLETDFLRIQISTKEYQKSLLSINETVLLSTQNMLKLMGKKILTFLRKLLSVYLHLHLSHNMIFPTMLFVRPAKAQTSLRIRAVWSEPLLVAWIF